MSALVDSMFSVRIAPWHNEGLILPEYPGTWNEARTLAGLDWEPVEEPVYRKLGSHKIGVPQLEWYGMDDLGEPIYKVKNYETVEVDDIETNPDDKHIVRSDNGKILSVVSDGYTLIDHAAMGEIIEAVLGQTNVKWETAGSLNGGNAVWVLVKLDEPIELPGDNSVTYPYLAITNRHDGTGACALRTTAVRIVCQNTFNMAEMEGQRHGATYSFRHSSKWRDRIVEAREAVTGARKEMQAWTQMATELLGMPINAGQRELFVRAFIPEPPQGLATERVLGNVHEAQEKLRQLFLSQTNEPVIHTAYGLVQAAGEYLDHVRSSRTWETRLNRNLMKPEPLKRKALKLVREIVTAGA
jgi:phage/plasmid-like protein (TIGR03299 family)